MSTNLRDIARINDVPGLYMSHALNALESAGIKDAADIGPTLRNKVPAFGSISLGYLTHALAKEVARLQSIINAAADAQAALSNERVNAKD